MNSREVWNIPVRDKALHSRDTSGLRWPWQSDQEGKGREERARRKPSHKGRGFHSNHRDLGGTGADAGVDVTLIHFSLWKQR